MLYWTFVSAIMVTLFPPNTWSKSMDIALLNPFRNLCQILQIALRFFLHIKNAEGCILAHSIAREAVPQLWHVLGRWHQLKERLALSTGYLSAASSELWLRYLCFHHAISCLNTLQSSKCFGLASWIWSCMWTYDTSFSNLDKLSRWQQVDSNPAPYTCAPHTGMMSYQNNCRPMIVWYELSVISILTPSPLTGYILSLRCQLLEILDALQAHSEYYLVIRSIDTNLYSYHHKLRFSSPHCTVYTPTIIEGIYIRFYWCACLGLITLSKFFSYSFPKKKFNYFIHFGLCYALYSRLFGWLCATYSYLK